MSGEYLQKDVGWPGDVVDLLLEEAGKPGIPWVEFSHTPQLPHLGIVRLLLTGQSEARRRGGVLIFCTNDHLPASALPECRYLPLSNENGDIAKPPRFGPIKRIAKHAMSHLPPASDEQLMQMEFRWRELMPYAGECIGGVMRSLRQSAKTTGSYAAWLTRSALDVIGMTCIVVPTSRLADALPSALRTLQSAAEVPGWRHCPSCGYRIGRWTEPGTDRCPACAATAPEAWDFRPDVVGRQSAMATTGLGLRVCGTWKPYQDRADELARTLFGIQPAERLRVTGRSLMRLEPSGLQAQRPNLLQKLVGPNSPDRLHLTPPDDPGLDWVC